MSPNCDNCGSHISPRYKAVMSDQNGEVWKCASEKCEGRKGHEPHLKGHYYMGDPDL